MAEAEKHTFISFSSHDRIKAKAICDCLEGATFKCWISSRDVHPGANYQASIVQAIQNATLMILVFSENTNLSQEVAKELSLASAFKVSVVPVRIADVKPNGALMYELATRQWIDGFEDWDGAMACLVATAQSLTAAPRGPADTISPAIAQPAIIKPPPAAPVVTIGKDQLEAARVALSYHIGPIADVLVRKASAKASSLADFHDRLAAQIRSPDEQAAFRRRLGRA